MTRKRCPFGTGETYLRQAIQQPSDSCIEWPYSRMKTGYGRVYIKGRIELAHRLSFLLTHGYLPSVLVCHSCDNPPCFNPRHLFEGDYKANMADSIAKGRFKFNRKGRPTLTLAQVREIRRDFKRVTKGKRHHGYHYFAKQYGVSSSAIQCIVEGRAWRGV